MLVSSISPVVEDVASISTISMYIMSMSLFMVAPEASERVDETMNVDSLLDTEVEMLISCVVPFAVKLPTDDVFQYASPSRCCCPKV